MLAVIAIEPSSRIEDAEDKLSEAAIKRSEADRVAKLADATKEKRAAE